MFGIIFYLKNFSLNVKTNFGLAVDQFCHGSLLPPALSVLMCAVDRLISLHSEEEEEGDRFVLQIC